MERVIKNIKDNIKILKQSSTKLNSFFFVKFIIKPHGKRNNEENLSYYFVKQRQLGVEYIGIINKNTLSETNIPNDILTLTRDEHIETVCNTILCVYSNLIDVYGSDYCICDLSGIRNFSFTFLEDKEERFDENAFEEYCKVNDIHVENNDVISTYEEFATSANPEDIVDDIIDILTDDNKYDMIEIIFKLKNPNWTKLDPEEKKILITTFELYPSYHPVKVDEDNLSGVAYVMMKLTKSQDTKTLGCCSIGKIDEVLLQSIDNLYKSTKDAFYVETLKMKVEFKLFKNN